MKDLIKLQNAHATQHDSDAGKTSWKIEENITNELLYELPSNIKDEDVFTILDFARKYELEALRAGINFQKKNSAFTFGQERDKLLKVIQELELANEKLSNKVHKFLEEV